MRLIRSSSWRCCVCVCYPNQWSPIHSLFHKTPQSQHHSALHRGHCMCMQPPGGERISLDQFGSAETLLRKNWFLTISLHRSWTLWTAFSQLLQEEQWGLIPPPSERSLFLDRKTLGGVILFTRLKKLKTFKVNLITDWWADMLLSTRLTCEASAVGKNSWVGHTPSWKPSLQFLQKMKPQPSCLSHSTLLLPSGGTSPAPQPGEGHINPPFISRHSSAPYCRYRSYWDTNTSDVTQTLDLLPTRKLAGFL